MSDKPSYCLICGDYLTTNEQYRGQRCLDPQHWQAGGQLSPRDYYLMAQMAATARAELIGPTENQGRAERTVQT